MLKVSTVFQPEILSVVNTRILSFCCMTPYILVESYKLFGGTSYHHVWNVRGCPEDAVGLSEITGTWIHSPADRNLDC